MDPTVRSLHLKMFSTNEVVSSYSDSYCQFETDWNDTSSNDEIISPFNEQLDAEDDHTEAFPFSSQYLLKRSAKITCPKRINQYQFEYPVQTLSSTTKVDECQITTLNHPEQEFSEALILTKIKVKRAPLPLPEPTYDNLQFFIELFHKSLNWQKINYQLAIESAFCRQSHHNYGKSRLATMVEALQNRAQSKENSPGKTHLFLICDLRSIIKSQLFKDELNKKNYYIPYDNAVDIILDICYRRFNSGLYYESHNELMENIGFKDDKAFSSEDFDIIEKSEYLKKNSLPFFAKEYKKLKGNFNINFDPHIYNIPYVYGVFFIGGKPITLLRMASITSHKEICPEFIIFIQACVFKYRKHLYISLQDASPRNILDESHRNELIKNLQKEFPKNFFVVILAQDSDFYRQEDPGPWPAEDFLEQFLCEMFIKENSGFYFPEAWKTEDVFIYNIGKILNEVHGIFYNSKEILNQNERKDFIELAYALLIPYFIFYCDASSVNVSCKDAIDRAGKVNSNLIYLYGLITNLASKNWFKKFHRVETHAPAMLAKAQPIVSSRRKRLISSNIVLNDAKEKLMGLVIPIWIKNPEYEISSKQRFLIYDQPLINPESDFHIGEKNMVTPAA